MFLGAVGAGSVLASGPTALSHGFASGDDAASLVYGKDPRLLVLKKHPAVLETPLKLLAEQRLTASSLLFVRNNQQPEDAATLAPASQAEWSVQLTGSVSRSARVSLSRLQALPQTSYEMVLQCSGNGRSLFSKAAQTSGTQWGRGGMGNVVFSGVRLSTVLDHLGIDIDPSVHYVNASGADEPLPDKEDFLHSLPIDDVLNRSILALDLNGSPLPAIHGGPIRLVTPGVYATMNLKWLAGLDFVAVESTNYNHVPRYRVPRQPIVPGTQYDFTLSNSSFNWKMKVKSVLLNPNDGDRIPAGRTILQGVAFNDGASRITDVYISTDKGETWRRTQLSRSDSLFGWTRFRLPVSLTPGSHEIWSRAVDSQGRSQPAQGSIAWNPRGYEWNGIEKITVRVA